MYVGFSWIFSSSFIVIIGAFHLHQNSDKSHFCLSSTFMLKKDRSEIYLSFDVNGKHLMMIYILDFFLKIEKYF